MFKITLLLYLFINVLYGFPTRVIPGSLGLYTRSHNDILNSAVRQAVGQFLRDNDYLDDDMTSANVFAIVDIFFGDDADAKEKYSSGVQEIFSYLEREELSNLAYVHCNGEQFLEAHNRILSFRNKIQQLAADSNPEQSLIRQYIGQSLYTIQAFYSTSNWIEMGRNKTYRDFGVPGKTLMTVASQNVDTCYNCDNSGNNVSSCKFNLLVTGVLTSGYRSGENAPSSHRNKASGTGKCGFGGSSDKNNGEVSATGGINKDRKDSTYSPHHHLHYDAFSSATEASLLFIIDPEIGLINEMGNDGFAKVFNLTKRYIGSFGFVIDVTGSMSDDIDEVKRQCTTRVTDVIGTVNEPKDYVLTTFSDPENLTKHVLTTNNGLLMIKTIQNLTVSGGGDCPEYALSGLLACINRARKKSTIFLFTDASFKDQQDFPKIITEANKKNIMVFFFLRNGGTCPRTRRSIERYKRQLNISASDLIAQATGGKVYRVPTNKISTAMKEVIEEYFPSATAILDMHSYGVHDSNIMTFCVDTSVRNLKIVVLGANATTEVDILNSEGSLVGAINTNILFENPNKIIISVVNPSPGKYSVIRLVPRMWNVNITCQTNIDFTYFILEEYDSNNWYRTSDSPIRGENYTLEIVAYNLASNSSIKEIVLTDNNGTKIFHNTTNGPFLYSTTTVYAKVSFDSESYQVGITGYDSVGNEFQRMAATMIYPSYVKLEILTPAELLTDTLTSILYTVTNKGYFNDTYSIIVEDNRGFVTANTTGIYYIPAGESVSSEFHIQGSSAYKSVTFTVTVKRPATGKFLQKQSKTVFVNSIRPPECSLNETFGNCSVVFYDGTCSHSQWYGTARITFSTEITSVMGTNGLHLEYEFSSTSLNINVSSDCCTSYGYVTVIDKNNNMQRCYFHTGEPVFLSESKPVLSTSGTITAGVVAGVVIACIVVAILIMIILYRTGKKRKSSKYDLGNLPPSDPKEPTVTPLELNLKL